MKKRILVDLDGICVNLFQAWIDTYNSYYLPKGANNIKISDLKTLDDITDNKNITKDIYKVIDGDWCPHFFRNLPEIEGAVDAINEIKNAGHEVIICSAPSRDPDSWSDKIYWIRKHLNIFYNGHIVLTGAKHLIFGDILIDDSVKNAKNWLSAHPNGVVAQINWPWNKNSLAQIKADSWEDTKFAWKNILENIL